MKKILSGFLAFAMACSALTFSGCNSEIVGVTSTPASVGGKADSTFTATADLSGKLTLNGSTSMAKVCQALGEAFMAKYPKTTVEKGGTGSGDAAKAVNAGTALIGDLSRDLKTEEKSTDFEIVQIAIDGIAIAVNKDNKVSSLTSDQITKIFTGAITNWKEVGGEDRKITLIGREATSGTRDGFEGLFKCAGKCKYAAEVTATGEVVAKVGSDKSAIGYVSLDSVNNTIKSCNVNGVKATEENIVNKTYVAQRPFIEIYKKGSDSDLIKAWFAFIKSSEGQKVIKDAGLIPAK
jgi:phosphate transport system substrate-binding protein